MNSLKQEQMPPSRPSNPYLDNGKAYHQKDRTTISDLWIDGLICAFEFVSRHRRKSRGRCISQSQLAPRKHAQDITKADQFSDPNSLLDTNISRDSHPEKNPHFSNDRENQQTSLFSVEELAGQEGSIKTKELLTSKGPEGMDVIHECYWVPIGWSRLSELVQMVQTDAEWASIYHSDEEDIHTVQDVVAPYWQRPVGPTWWCHVMAGHPVIESWLKSAHWLHPAISTALRDESRLISEKMKHLYYEVPVRVAGGLLFELIGQSQGDPNREEDDVPIVLRSWQAQKFLVTVMHVKERVSNLNALGIIEIQDLLIAGGAAAPKTAHELIANLISRLSRWDDRSFRKYIFGAADEVELKFVHRRNNEDLALLSIILNQEVKRLSTQVIRVKWNLHAREEIIFELQEHLRGRVTQEILSNVRQSTREMIGEQEAVRDRLFTVQDVMQNTVRAWLQDRSVRITHNISVFGGGGLVLTIITGLFGINVDGIPGGENTPYAFALFTGLLLVLGVALIGFGMLYFGLKKPITDEQVAARKLELQSLIKKFQVDAETHAKVRNNYSRHSLQQGGDVIENSDYVLIP